MASSKPARLKVILGESNTEKLTLPDGIPDSLDELLSKVKDTFGLKTNVRLQYMDKEFGNDFFNLSSTSDLEDLGTVKVIQEKAIQTFVDVIETAPSCSTVHSDDSSSLASNDTIILSSPESLSSRTQQWPANFPIPIFSYDTERQLEKGNSEYQANNKMLTVTSRMKSDILNRLVEEIYRYRAYPEDAQFCVVAEALVKKHPCLKEPGSFNGCYGWKQRLKYKMGNYRTLLKSQGCPELSVNSLKSKASISVSPAAKIKKPRRAEANFYPSFPLGETQESMEKERIELLAAIKRRNNDRVIAEKMARTFAYRRQEVVNEEPGIGDFKDRWPALFFFFSQINADFQRLMAVPLEQTFLAQLDRHSNQLIKVIQAKGGLQCSSFNILFNSLQGSSGDDAQMELKQLTMAVFVIRKEEEGLKEPPEDIGIVIEGVEVLQDLTSVASACALLLGLIYSLNLAYPKALRFTFEVFQKIFMQLEQHKMSPKVQNLFGRLQTSQ
uniref:PB1 domain-containing protein n=1 Tax=Cyprinodon variegatus TaxID=28743 RepID=A0A3Q2D2W4_CYPVA